MNFMKGGSMIKKLKCWFFGHLWIQKGFNKIRHIQEDEDFITTSFSDHHLFICRRCSEIREHACTFNYYEISEESPYFSNNKDVYGNQNDEQCD